MLKKCTVLSRNFLGLVYPNNTIVPAPVSFKLSYMLNVFELLLLFVTC